LARSRGGAGLGRFALAEFAPASFFGALARADPEAQAQEREELAEHA
jgi:hypothetical protein